MISITMIPIFIGSYKIRWCEGGSKRVYRIDYRGWNLGNSVVIHPQLESHNRIPVDGAFGGCSFGHIIWRILDSQSELQELWTVQICVLYLWCSFKKVSVQSVMFCKRVFAAGFDDFCSGFWPLVAGRSTQYPVLCFDGLRSVILGIYQCWVGPGFDVNSS